MLVCTFWRENEAVTIKRSVFHQKKQQQQQQQQQQQKPALPLF